MSHKNALVCQYLENISRDVLKRYQDIIRMYVGRRQGIYALYRKGDLYYVGLASNLRSRLRSHLRDRHGQSWDRFSVYLTLADTHMKELESLILRIVQPSGNRIQGKFANTESLKRRLKRDLQEKQNVELDSIIGHDEVEDEEQFGKHDESEKPILAQYKNFPKKLKRKYKGKTIKAMVLKNGRIRVLGRTFNSPSLAAAAACGRRTANGWKFWLYERAPGYWVKLNELRKK